MERKEHLILNVATIRKAFMEKELLLNIIALPDTIGKPELEAYYLLLKGRKKVLSHLDEAYYYLIDNHVIGPKEMRPMHNKRRDRKEYLGKNGILKRLEAAGLLEREYDARKKKKRTWRTKIVLKWPHRVLEDEQAKEGGIVGQAMKESFFTWTDEHLIQGLEGYLYRGNPELTITKKERQDLERMSIKELEEELNGYITLMGIRDAMKENKEEEKHETARRR